MSYCRWSSDDYTCDVYVYESFGDVWVTHVANRRWVSTTELPEPVELIPGDEARLTAWFERHRLVLDRHGDPEHGHWLELTEHVGPDGAEDVGASFEHETPGECAANLQRLASLGFNVPQGVIADLLEERSEGDKQAG